MSPFLGIQQHQYLGLENLEAGILGRAANTVHLAQIPRAGTEGDDAVLLSPEDHVITCLLLLHEWEERLASDSVVQPKRTG